MAQPLRRAFPDEKEAVDRQRVQKSAVRVPREDRGGVWLFVVAAQLGKRLVERDADGDRQPRLLLHDTAQLVRNFRPGAEEQTAARYVQPAFVDAERLYLIGVAQIDFIDKAGVFDILLTVRRGEDEVRTFPPGLPDRLSSLHAEFLGFLIFGQHNSVPAVRIAAYGHRYIAVFRMEQALHRGIESVAVAVQDDPVVHLKSGIASGKARVRSRCVHRDGRLPCFPAAR